MKLHSTLGPVYGVIVLVLGISIFFWYVMVPAVAGIVLGVRPPSVGGWRGFLVGFAVGILGLVVNIEVDRILEAPLRRYRYTGWPWGYSHEIETVIVWGINIGIMVDAIVLIWWLCRAWGRRRERRQSD